MSLGGRLGVDGPENPRHSGYAFLDKKPDRCEEFWNRFLSGEMKKKRRSAADAKTKLTPKQGFFSQGCMANGLRLTAKASMKLT